ncbi:hypothetical protein J4457_05940, partial [Candidatus Woesearchaeota archaeon]|nr:hypothetical protein [Candidatus Woesearchaeota archaeon]
MGGIVYTDIDGSLPFSVLVDWRAEAERRGEKLPVDYYYEIKRIGYSKLLFYVGCPGLNNHELQTGLDILIKYKSTSQDLLGRYHGRMTKELSDTIKRIDQTEADVQYVLSFGKENQGWDYKLEKDITLLGNPLYETYDTGFYDAHPDQIPERRVTLSPVGVDQEFHDWLAQKGVATEDLVSQGDGTYRVETHIGFYERLLELRGTQISLQERKSLIEQILEH